MNARVPDIELVFFDGCPNAGTARQHLRVALEQAGLEGDWQEWNVDDPGTPADRRRFGSPTVLIDGRDVLGAEPGAVGRSCRTEGAPSVEAIVQELRSD